jgi:DedD protein
VFEPAEERRDREFTLGPTMLVAMVCGLLLLCTLCFVFGFAMGRRSSSDAVATSATSAAITSRPQATGAQSKPSAAQSGTLSQESAVADVSTTAATEAVPATTAQSTENPAQSTAPAPQRAIVPAPISSATNSVQPALPMQPQVAAAVPGGGARVAPALPQGESIMVQIAAVSHPEDAQVLVGALRKRGYIVASRRDPADGLLHVQVGPFSNRTDANAMRLKLLNDGYNAIVQ